MKLRQFWVRDVKHVDHEWNLVGRPCMEYQTNERIENGLKCPKDGNRSKTAAPANAKRTDAAVTSANPVRNLKK